MDSPMEEKDHMELSPAVFQLLFSSSHRLGRGKVLMSGVLMGSGTDGQREARVPCTASQLCSPSRAWLRGGWPGEGKAAHSVLAEWAISYTVLARLWGGLQRLGALLLGSK